MRLIAESGADTDDKARRRLVAGARHTITMGAMGAASPEVAASSARDLADELDAIDSDEE